MSRREWVSTGVALSALSTGLLVYAFGRDPATLAWLPAGWAALLPAPADPVPWTGWLPSFLHTLGFILLTVVAAGVRGRARIALLSLAWVGVESLFEFGQHPAVAAAWAARLSALTGFDGAGAYFVNGTFDWLDLLAVATAGGLAWAVASRGLPEEKAHV